MARWFCTLCMALILALAAFQPAEAMDMSAKPMADLAQCDACPDDDSGEPCAVACLVPSSALAPAISLPVTLANVRFTCRRPDVLAGCAGPPEPQPPRLLARG